MCKKGLHIDVVGTDESNWGAKFNLQSSAQNFTAPTLTEVVGVRFNDRCFFYGPVYQYG